MSRSAVLLGLLVSLGAALPISTASATPDQTVLVTRGYDGRPGQGGIDGHSWGPEVSADGTRVAFTSGADNLWTGPASDQYQAVVRDLTGPAFLLASRDDGADGAPTDDGGALAGRDTASTGITADGRYVDFIGQLLSHPGLLGWRRDLLTGATTLLSVDEHGQPVSPSGPILAAGGDRYVVYGTGAGIYLRDLQTGTLTLVSRATGVDGRPVDGSLVGVSPGGRYVTFLSGDGTLAAGVSGTAPYAGAFVYVRDVRRGQTLMASRANGRNGRPVGVLTSASVPVRGDGCQVVFDALGDDVALGSPANGGMEVYLRDLCQGTTTLVSQRADGTAAQTPPPAPFGQTADTSTQAMSADGRYVLFGTAAGNLDDDAPFGVGELYVRDVIGNRTILVSRGDGSDGPISDVTGRYSLGAMTPDARYVVFSANTTTLTPDNTLGFEQVYRRELASVPPAPDPVLICGEIDDPGVGGTAAPPCPGDGGGDGGGGADGGTTTPPTPPTPVTVTVPGPGGAPAAPGPAATTTGVTEPTLVRAPTLRAITATRTAVRAWVDLPSTVQVAIARQDGRRWRTQRTIKVVVKQAGRVSVKLPKLSRLRYRLTIRALGASGTESPAIVRTVDLRPRKAQHR